MLKGQEDSLAGHFGKPAACIFQKHIDPDYTVGFGVSPNHALRLVGCTTGRDLHPALKIFYSIYSKYHTSIL